MSREAMKQALEALEQINELSIGENAIALPGEIDGAMDALRAALDAQERDYERGFVDGMQEQMKRSVDRAVNAKSDAFKRLARSVREFAAEQRAIEAKLKEKNS